MASMTLGGTLLLTGDRTLEGVLAGAGLGIRLPPSFSGSPSGLAFGLEFLSAFFSNFGSQRGGGIWGRVDGLLTSSVRYYLQAGLGIDRYRTPLDSVDTEPHWRGSIGWRSGVEFLRGIIGLGVLGQQSLGGPHTTNIGLTLTFDGQSLVRSVLGVHGG
jgi:hypothetical protein